MGPARPARAPRARQRLQRRQGDRGPAPRRWARARVARRGQAPGNLAVSGTRSVSRPRLRARTGVHGALQVESVGIGFAYKARRSRERRRTRAPEKRLRRRCTHGSRAPRSRAYHRRSSAVRGSGGSARVEVRATRVSASVSATTPASGTRAVSHQACAPGRAAGSGAGVETVTASDVGWRVVDRDRGVVSVVGRSVTLETASVDASLTASTDGCVRGRPRGGEHAADLTVAERSLCAAPTVPGARTPVRTTATTRKPTRPLGRGLPWVRWRGDGWRWWQRDIWGRLGGGSNAPGRAPLVVNTGRVATVRAYVGQRHTSGSRPEGASDERRPGEEGRGRSGRTARGRSRSRRRALRGGCRARSPCRGARCQRRESGRLEGGSRRCRGRPARPTRRGRGRSGVRVPRGEARALGRLESSPAPRGTGGGPRRASRGRPRSRCRAATPHGATPGAPRAHGGARGPRATEGRRTSRPPACRMRGSR